MRVIPNGIVAATALFAVSPTFAQSVAQPVKPLPTVSAKTVAASITGIQMRSYLEFIASDALMGRDTPSQGLDVAAEFLAFHLRGFGLKPAGDNGTYFQKVPLARTVVDSKKTALRVGETAFTAAGDLFAERAGGSGVGTGGIVFATPESLAAAPSGSLKGQIVATFADLFTGRGPLRSFDDAAIEAGAAGVLHLVRSGDQATFVRTRAGNEANMARFGGGFSPSGSDKTPPTTPVIAVGPDATKALLTGTALADSLAPAAKPPTAVTALGKTATVQGGVSVETTSTRNVVAIAEGTDPTLKGEYVAIGAHYDHVGVNPNPRPGEDAIFNGADDDGSGTVAVLALAKTFATNRPKRSIVFVWHCGEEKGLWGSEYFTDHPTVPIDKIVTQLNIDMIGRSKKAGDTNPRNANLTRPNEIYVVGSKKMSTDLGNVSERVNSGYFNLSFNYLYDAPDDRERIFFRSDHYNYARKGVPIIFYFDGVHEDYHRPGDEVSKIDFAKMEQVTRTVFVTAVDLANNPARPKVDKPLK